MSLPFLILVVLFAPLVSAALIAAFAHRSKPLSVAISITAVLLSLVASLAVFFAPAENVTLSIPWIAVGEFQMPIGFTVDGLSKAMMLVVTVIGTLIHLYSLGYMKDDAGKSRYFGSLSLFMFSMLGIVFANNFVMMFIFWELVGVSSFLLIGHWFQNNAPPAAANKAFITNRIGDFGFMLGILLVWQATGSIEFSGIAANLDGLKANTALATLAALAVFCGTLGKSAQFPLHVWLPDAMEGPTPVSALIHAATMVAAGVYMLARVFFLFEIAPTALEVIMWIGIITAVLAALMATQQSDIKRILAYSTLSQLGYMVMAVGLVAKDAAMFHLVTHAFFKALLFLGAGAVIYACHHEQNIWKMGGLGLKKLPFTFITFLIGTAALMGIPGLSGFFSKDAILIAAEQSGHTAVYYLALFVAFLTAFYMARLFVVVFFGGSRSEDAEKAREVPVIMWLPLVLLAIPSVIAGYEWAIGGFIPVPAHVEGSQVPIFATVAALLGIAVGFLIYRGRSHDPLHNGFTRILEHRFYIDEFYAKLIHFTHDLAAHFCAFFDRWVIDFSTRLLAGCSWGVGFALRYFQVGNLQGYAILFGLGVVGLLYYLIIL